VLPDPLPTPCRPPALQVACNRLVPGSYHACTWLAPPKRLACTSHVPGLKGPLRRLIRHNYLPSVWLTPCIPPVFPLYSPCIPHVLNTLAVASALAKPGLRPGMLLRLLTAARSRTHGRSQQNLLYARTNPPSLSTRRAPAAESLTPSDGQMTWISPRRRGAAISGLTYYYMSIYSLHVHEHDADRNVHQPELGAAAPHSRPACQTAPAAAHIPGVKLSFLTVRARRGT
jgi:hypothetical protein